jgi:hypothetical protein
MKYTSPAYVHQALEYLPAFMILLHERTVQNAMEALGALEQSETAVKFITHVETFIFILINIADPQAMEHGFFRVKDPADYNKRRNDLLVSLGLKEYARTTYLLNPNALHPQFRNN